MSPHHFLLRDTGDTAPLTRLLRPLKALSGLPTTVLMGKGKQVLTWECDQGLNFCSSAMLPSVTKDCFEVGFEPEKLLALPIT